jgi:hypothetical protein
MKKPIRVDFILSFWIFLCFILYAAKLSIYNPKPALYLGMINNIIMLYLMVFYGSNSRTIFYYILFNSIIKLIPLYYLRNTPIRINDYYITVGLFILFNIWLYLNSQNLIQNSRMIYNSLIHNTDEMPFLYFVDYVEKAFQK